MHPSLQLTLQPLHFHNDHLAWPKFFVSNVERQETTVLLLPCNSSCRARFRTDYINAEFENELK